MHALQVPADILNNAALNAAIAILPGNYNFEIHKVRGLAGLEGGASHAALHRPPLQQGSFCRLCRQLRMQRCCTVIRPRPGCSLLS